MPRGLDQECDNDVSVPDGEEHRTFSPAPLNLPATSCGAHSNRATPEHPPPASALWWQPCRLQHSHSQASRLPLQDPHPLLPCPYVPQKSRLLRQQALRSIIPNHVISSFYFFRER